MEVAIFFAALLGLWAYIRHDQRRIRDSPVELIDRKQFRRGYVPGLSVKWMGLAGMALISGGMSLLNYVSPKAPPFTGRWSWVYSVLFEIAGKYGAAIVFGLASLAFASSAIVAYQATATQRKHQDAA